MASFTDLIAGAKQLLAGMLTRGAILLVRSNGAAESTDSLTSLQAGPNGGLLTEPATGADVASETTLAALLAKLVAPGTWTPATAAAAADSGVISAAATTVRSILATNKHASTTTYLQLFDSATVPADATAPRLPSIPVGPGQTVLVQIGALACTNGLSWASSSTVNTKTITALTSMQCSAEIG